MSDDLKPCPGCASRNLFDGPTAIGNPERYVRCYQCGMSGAFTAWNRRASDAEIERLRAVLVEARDDVGSWGAYASPYFQEKWDLEGNIARIDAALSPLPAKKGGAVD